MIIGALVLLTWILLTGKPLSEIVTAAVRLLQRAAVAAGGAAATAARAGARKAAAALSSIHLPEMRRARTGRCRVSE